MNTRTQTHTVRTHTQSQSNAHTAALRLTAAECQLFVLNTEGIHAGEKSLLCQSDELGSPAEQPADTVHH